MSWKVISFYTEDYKDEVATLIKSLDMLKLPYDIECVKSKGNWKKNTFQKIPYIVKKLKQYNHPLLWLDADAEVIQYPVLIDSIGDALMAGVYTPLKSHEFVSNTMYFVPSKEVFEYLRETNKFIEELPNAYDTRCVGEQYYMQVVLEANRWKEHLRFKELPYSYAMPSYWKTCQYRSLCKDDYVIKQRQASRRKNPDKRDFYKRLGLSVVD